MRFHVENVNHPCGSEHNAVVEYASVENVIRFFLPTMPAGAYTIHTLDPSNIYREPIKSTAAYRRATRAETKVDALLERARTRRFWKIDRGATT